MGRTELGRIAAGIVQTSGVIGAVVAFGLGWAACGAGWSGADPYTPRPMEPKVRWLVDGFNVLHAGVLRGNDRHGWWREEMRGRLLTRVAAFEDAAAELWVVFDGPGPGAASETASLRPHVVFAPSADEWLLAEVSRAGDAAQVVVVTADRQLADRARHRGAQVVAPRSFLARCRAPEDA